MNTKTLAAGAMLGMLAVTGCQAEGRYTLSDAHLQKVSLQRPSQLSRTIRLYTLLPSKTSRAIAFTGERQAEHIVRITPLKPDGENAALRIVIKAQDGKDYTMNWVRTSDDKLEWRGRFPSTQLYYLEMRNEKNEPVPVKIDMQVIPMPARAS